MSIEVTTWVYRHSEERLGRRLVLLVLADHANDDGSGAWPSVETISEKARLSRSQTQRCLRALESEGAVEKAGKSRAGTTIYNVIMTPEGGPQYEAPEQEGGRKSDENEGVNAARSVLEPPIAVTTDVVTDASEPPKVVLVGGKNLGYDVLGAMCRIKPGSPRAREIPVALKSIREQWWSEVSASVGVYPSGDPWVDPEQRERQFATDISARAILYKQKLPGATMTPTALAKWWTDLPDMEIARDGRSGSALDIVDDVDAAVRRARGEA